MCSWQPWVWGWLCPPLPLGLHPNPSLPTLLSFHPASLTHLPGLVCPLSVGISASPVPPYPPSPAYPTACLLSSYLYFLVSLHVDYPAPHSSTGSWASGFMLIPACGGCSTSLHYGVNKRTILHLDSALSTPDVGAGSLPAVESVLLLVDV